MLVLPVNGKRGKLATPSGAAPHLPLHRGGFGKECSWPDTSPIIRGRERLPCVRGAGAGRRLRGC